MDIGGRIRQLREAQGWTTNYLANRCGVSQSFLRSVELGEKGISVESLSLVCGALNISLKTFFDVPSEKDSLDELLLRRLQHMTSEQKQTLIAFLDTIK